jgi:hypothetical protein
MTAREVVANAANLPLMIRDRELDRITGTRAERMKTTRERAEEKRQEKLDLVREQVESGSLVIRQMTDEERKRYPPRPAAPKKRLRR